MPPRQYPAVGLSWLHLARFSLALRVFTPSVPWPYGCVRHKKTTAPLWLRRSRWCIMFHTRDLDAANIGESGGCTVGAVSRHFFWRLLGSLCRRYHIKAHYVQGKFQKRMRIATARGAVEYARGAVSVVAAGRRRTRERAAQPTRPRRHPLAAGSTRPALAAILRALGSACR